MKAALVGRKQEIFAFVIHQNRVGRRAKRTIGFDIVVVRLEIIADVYRVTKGFRVIVQRVEPFGCPCLFGFYGCFFLWFQLKIDLIPQGFHIHCGHFHSGVINHHNCVTIVSQLIHSLFISIVVCRTVLIHNCCAFEWFTVGTGNLTCPEFLLLQRDGIITYLAFYYDNTIF